MFLNTTSPRKSFSVPININLQGARRRQTREFLSSAAVHDQDWCRGGDGRGGQRARSQVPVSSVGEDRAILLGFTMMAFSVLMFFLVGITMIKPFVTSKWEEEAGCVLVQADILKEWVDCRGISTVPCLRVMVNLTGSNQSAFLHLDEESVLLAPECFYLPKCRMDRTDLQAEVQRVKKALDVQLGSASSCFTDRTRHPSDVILSRKYTWKKALFALLWPCVMLGGGALLVGLVKLTQCLAHLSAEVCSQGAGSRLTTRYTQGKLYRLLRRSSAQTPS
ncbi:calcium-activated potassium channel subunit beta-3-like [Solea senegalensis]|uniref:Calcium-activated potassium channel subunit beta-3-like n=1 Tax=Solea senegalensis TaxID=28829 RepID=A0AAV6T6W4_SOLSE|nr:calcium-activated potassium channel subunit beta-3 [Solea senegalensis]KAG7525119.1 calcium-activated potassium channel subunit beta-3-like [Solea senegalensis]